MNIKKNSKSSVLIESSQVDVKIENLFYNGTISTKINFPDKAIDITKPGDYEYNHISFTGFEVPSEKYKGIINLLKIIVEDVSVVFLFADSEIGKEVVAELVDIDVLITPFYSPTRLKEHIADIDPKTLLVLRNFENSAEFDVEDMKKTLGVSSMDEASSYKYRSMDFGNDDEYTLSTFILK